VRTLQEAMSSFNNQTTINDAKDMVKKVNGCAVDHEAFRKEIEEHFKGDKVEI
jgi:hypothetical protein